MSNSGVILEEILTSCSMVLGRVTRSLKDQDNMEMRGKMVRRNGNSLKREGLVAHDIYYAIYLSRY